MALTPSAEIACAIDDLGPLAAVLDDLTAAGAGWVNLTPEVEPGAEPPPRTFVALIFSGRGAAVPLVTWTAPDRPGGRVSVGIQHGAGPKALARLADAEHALPAGWTKLNDHPRRGLVLTVPADVAPADVVAWLLGAATVLSPAPLTGHWLAKVFRP